MKKFRVYYRKMGFLKCYQFDNFKIGKTIELDGNKYRIKALGVKIKQQPVTKEWFFDLDKNTVLCLNLSKKEDGLRFINFKYEIVD